MRRRRQLPSYVRRLVVEAGSDSVFWSSVRDPGQRPDIGSGMDRLVNRVVGSGVSASQSTASAQPIWRGDRVEFSGDDVYDATNSIVTEGFTSVVVSNPGSGSTDIYGTSSSTTEVGARWSGSPSLFVRSQDEAGNGNSAWGVHCQSGLQRCVSILTGSTASGDAHHVSIGATDGLETSSITFTSSSDWHLDGFQIGNIGGTAVDYEGDISEVAIAAAFVNQATATEIAETLAAKWGI